MQFLNNLIGDNKPLLYLAVAVLALVVVLLLIAGYRLLFGPRIRSAGGRSRQPRLGVVDAYDLDRQRQLVLVRRDNVEHLIMIGGPNDLLIEPTIVRGQPAVGSPPAPMRDAAPLAPAMDEATVPAPAPPVIPARPEALGRNADRQTIRPEPQAVRPEPQFIPEPPARPEPPVRTEPPLRPEPLIRQEQVLSPEASPPPPGLVETAPQPPQAPAVTPPPARTFVPPRPTPRSIPPIPRPSIPKTIVMPAPSVEPPPPPAPEPVAQPEPAPEAASHAPAPEPAPVPVVEAPAKPEPTPLPPEPPKPAAPLDPLDALEQEMARLLNRPAPPKP